MIYRSDTALIIVSVVGVTIDTESWDLFEGGEKKTDGLKVWSGGMKDGQELGGTPTREPIKVSRKWSDVLIGAFAALDAAAGNGEMEVSVQTLNASKVPVGTPVTYSGILLEVGRPMAKAGPSEEIMLMLTMGSNVPLVA